MGENKGEKQVSQNKLVQTLRALPFWYKIGAIIGLVAVIVFSIFMPQTWAFGGPIVGGAVYFFTAAVIVSLFTRERRPKDIAIGMIALWAFTILYAMGVANNAGMGLMLLYVFTPVIIYAFMIMISQAMHLQSVAGTGIVFTLAWGWCVLLGIWVWLTSSLKVTENKKMWGKIILIILFLVLILGMKACVDVASSGFGF